MAERDEQFPYVSTLQQGNGDVGAMIAVIDKAPMSIAHKPRWKRESNITSGQSIKPVVEVVSTNWRDDYLVKLRL